MISEPTIDLLPVYQGFIHEACSYIVADMIGRATHPFARSWFGIYSVVVLTFSGGKNYFA